MDEWDQFLPESSTAVATEAPAVEDEWSQFLPDKTSGKTTPVEDEWSQFLPKEQSKTPETDKALASTKTKSFLPKSGAQMDAQEAKVFATAPPLIPAPHFQIHPDDPWNIKFGKAANNTLGEFVSGMTSAGGIAGLLNPWVGAGEMAASVPSLIQKVQEADKTPAGSPERYQAGADVAGFVALVTAGAQGLKEGMKAKAVARSGEPPATSAPPVEQTKLQGSTEAPVVPQGAGLTPETPAVQGETAVQGQLEVPASSTTGLPEAFAGLAKGISDNFYTSAFESLVKGKDTIAGVKDPILVKAKPLFDAGEIKSPADLRDFVQSGRATKVQGEGGGVEVSRVDPSVAKTRLGGGLLGDYGTPMSDLPKTLEGDLRSSQSPATPISNPSFGRQSTNVSIKSTGKPSSQVPKAAKSDTTAGVSEPIPPEISPTTGQPIPKAETGIEGAITEIQRRNAVDQPEPRQTGIAQRIHDERAKSNQIGEIIPGEGVSAEAMVDRGRTLIEKAGVDPVAVAERVNQTKQVSGDDMAVLRARHEQLSRATNAAEDAHNANPADPILKGNYEQAFKAETDWAQNAVKPAQTEWHKMGQAQQGATDIDTGTFTGLRRAFNDTKGRDVTPPEAVKLKQTAQKVQKITSEVDATRAKLSEVIDQSTKGRKPKTLVELRERFAERIRAKTPC